MNNKVTTINTLCISVLLRDLINNEPLLCGLFYKVLLGKCQVLPYETTYNVSICNQTCDINLQNRMHQGGYVIGQRHYHRTATLTYVRCRCLLCVGVQTHTYTPLPFHHHTSPLSGNTNRRGHLC